MPHLVLEYSDNMADHPDFQQLFNSIHLTLEKTGHFKIADIKSRAVKHDTYLIGNGEPDRSFVTINLAILSGRTDEFKKNLSAQLLEILKHHFPITINSQKSSITVQISEIHQPSYRKLTGPGY